MAILIAAISSSACSTTTPKSFAYFARNTRTGVDGDTYLSFTESLSFSSDSNNAPSQATTSELRLGPVLWEMACRALLGLAAALA